MKFIYESLLFFISVFLLLTFATFILPKLAIMAQSPSFDEICKLEYGIDFEYDKINSGHTCVKRDFVTQEVIERKEFNPEGINYVKKYCRNVSFFDLDYSYRCVEAEE